MFNCDSPIFIFGSGRSGTSLLSRILNSHPRIGIPFESHLYEKFLLRLRYYGDLSVESNRRALLQDMVDLLYNWSPRASIDRSLAGMKENSLHGAIDSLIFDWCCQLGKKRWGEKTPNHGYYWEEILRGFPNAKFVHIIRDGRDVAISWKQARFGPKHYYVAAKRWRDYLITMAEARKSILTANFFELRYEDLIRSPETTLRALCAYLGEEYYPEMLSFHKDTTPYPTDKRNLRNLSQPLMRHNINKWVYNMTPKEVFIFEAIAKEQLEQNGYPVKNTSAHVEWPMAFCYEFMLHPILRMCSMAKNTKGQADALKQLWVFSRSRLSSFLR